VGKDFGIWLEYVLSNHKTTIMKNRETPTALILIFGMYMMLMAASSVYAQGPPPPPTGVPIDGGIVTGLCVAFAIGIKLFGNDNTPA